MPNNFDWQTDENRRGDDSEWDVVDAGGRAQNRPQPATRGRVITAAILGLVLLISGAFAWQQVDRRIEDNLGAIRSDVAAGYNIVRQAADTGDEELLRTVLSGRDPAWTDALLGQFSAGLMIDRAAVGLPLSEGAKAIAIEIDAPTDGGNTANTTIDFSPDLSEAVVVQTWPYTDETGQLIPLRQTAVFRRGESRWLLSPPIDEFWGETATDTVGRLRLTYPTRDAELVLRLATDLNRTVERACAELPDIRCVNELPVTLLFDTSPAALERFTDLLGGVRKQEQPPEPVILPTPTLLGLPADNDAAAAGYQALLRRYESRLLAAVVARSVGYECCQRSQLFEALLNTQLHQLGIVPAPITAADRQFVLDERIRLADIAPLWRTGRQNATFWDERRLAQLAVGFLQQSAPAVPTAALQRSLNEAADLYNWINTHLAKAGPTTAWVGASLEQAWWIYALQGTLATAGTGDTVATEDLYLSCTPLESGDVRRPSQLLRYGAPGGDWELLHSLEGFIWMSTLPDPETLLLQELVLSTETWQTSIWRDGYQTLYRNNGADYTISLGETDPTGRFLISYAIDAATDNLNPQALDLRGCTADCAPRPLARHPVWSPDGTQALYSGLIPEALRSSERIILLDVSSSIAMQQLALGPAIAAAEDELQPVAEGYAPFWLDDATFGYITPAADSSTPNQRIMLQSVSGGEPRRILSTRELVALLPGSEFRRDSFLAYVAPHPTNRDLLFITLVDRNSSRSFVFAHDLETGETGLRVLARADMNHSLGFSPDGRYLVLTGRNLRPTMIEDNDALLLLHDIAANRTLPFITRLPFFLSSSSYDWTTDGSRLAIALDDNLIGIVNPDEETVLIMPHKHGSCTALAFMER